MPPHARVMRLSAAALACAMIMACATASAGGAGGDPSSHYMAAVVQHITVDDPSGDAAKTLLANMEAYAGHAADAAAKGAQFVNFPEFGLYGSDFSSKCGSATTPNGLCEPMPPAGAKVNPCTAGRAGAGAGAGATGNTAAPAFTMASCIARNASLTASFNMCEAAREGNYNTQVVFDASGAMVAKYRKSHVALPHCFLKPATPDLVTFEADFGVTMGVFTCFDIVFDSPGAVLARQGVRHFTYSAAIPVVGADAVRLFSWAHNVTMVYSDVRPGMSGVYVGGHRTSPSAPSGKQDAVMVAAVLK